MYNIILVLKMFNEKIADVAKHTQKHSWPMSIVVSVF